MTVIERFMKFVIKAESGCWLWSGNKNDRGRPLFWLAGKSRRAHRVSFELFNGEIPDGHGALHRCDNIGCVNPSHLFSGTQADNNHDMWKKGRGACGDKKRIKLNSRKVLSIRARYAAGESQSSLADEFGIHQVTVSEIVTRKIWKSIGG